MKIGLLKILLRWHMNTCKRISIATGALYYRELYQLGDKLPYKQKVTGSSPVLSTTEVRIK